MTQPANRRLVTEDRFLVTEAEAAAAYDAVNSIASLSPNYIINGAFDIWQRGTSFAVGTGAPYTADRWQAIRAAVSGITVSRQSAGLSNFQYCARVQRDSGVSTTASAAFWQNLETINSIPLQGKTITVSFYARAGANYSAASSAFLLQVYTGTGTDQNVNIGGFTGATVIASTTSTLTTSWQRFTATGTVGTSATQVAALFLSTPTGVAGASDYFEITGVQLEVGTVATAFRRNAPSIQGELAACQRYYWRSTAIAPYTIFSTATCANATSGDVVIQFPVTMRGRPASLESTAASTFLLGNSIAFTGIAYSTSYSNAQSASIQFTGATGLAAYQAAKFMSNNSSTSYIAFNAEL